MKEPMETTYESIYRACFPKLVNYLQYHSYPLHDAEDMASRAMLILWEKWASLPSHTQEGLLCWLLSTVRNLMRDDIKKKARTPTVLSLDDLTEHDHPVASPDPSPRQIETEYRERLWELTRQLPHAEATLLWDKIERHLSDEQIAAKLGISINAVRIRWTRTKSHIALLLECPDTAASKSPTSGSKH